MAKKIKQAKQARDFTRKKITIAPGVEIDNKIKFGTRLLVEEEYGKSWADIDWNVGKNTAILVYYLARQLKPEIKRQFVLDALEEADMVVIEQILMQIYQQSLKKALIPEAMKMK